VVFPFVLLDGNSSGNSSGNLYQQSLCAHPVAKYRHQNKQRYGNRDHYAYLYDDLVRINGCQ